MSRRPPPAARTHRGRGDILRQGLTVILLLLEAPHRPGDLARKLGCSRRTVERILRVIESTRGLRLTVERDGRLAWYRISSGPLARAVAKSKRS